jgi:hypothetical protein
MTVKEVSGALPKISFDTFYRISRRPTNHKAIVGALFCTTPGSITRFVE